MFRIAVPPSHKAVKCGVRRRLKSRCAKSNEIAPKRRHSGSGLSQPAFSFMDLFVKLKVRRGYPVDIGVVMVDERKNSIHQTRQYEIDFVVNRGPKQMYIQSAYSIPTAEKQEQETFSLRHTGDSFRKVVITNDPFQTRPYDDSGIAYIGLVDFLLDIRSLETLQ